MTMCMPERYQPGRPTQGLLPATVRQLQRNGGEPSGTISHFQDRAKPRSAVRCRATSATACGGATEMTQSPVAHIARGRLLAARLTLREVLGGRPWSEG